MMYVFCDTRKNDTRELDYKDYKFWQYVNIEDRLAYFLLMILGGGCGARSDLPLGGRGGLGTWTALLFKGRW